MYEEIPKFYINQIWNIAHRFILLHNQICNSNSGRIKEIIKKFEHFTIKKISITHKTVFTSDDDLTDLNDLVG